MDDFCFLKIGCMPQIGCRPLRLPMDYDSFSPFVVATFQSPKGAEVLRVTVGNESYPSRPNTAVIKSMEYGYMDKPQATLEVVDEAGGEMGLLVDAVRKCGQNVLGSTMELSFGWVKSNCEGTGESDWVTFDGFINMTLYQIDVSYGEGLVRYTLQGTALDVVTTNQREDENRGPGMRLVDAIGRICETKGITPVYASVQADGSVKTAVAWPPGLSADEAPWEWEGFGADGPKGSWQGSNNDVLSTISKWIEPYRIKHGTDGAGVLMVFDSMNHKRLFLWKNPRYETRCPPNTISDSDVGGLGADIGGRGVTGLKSGMKRGTLGTFVVNGGKCSPVIRFDPKLNYISGQAKQSTGGTPSSADDSGAQVTENNEKPSSLCPDDKENVGPENQATIPQNARENYPPDRVHREVLRSNMAHIKANIMTEFQIAPIQGDLVVHGMPFQQYVDMTMFLFAPMSIIVMNPFFIAGNVNDGCGDWSWLASSGCNEVLSDKHYICQGVNHSIKEGSYTTTFKVINVNSMKVDTLENVNN